MRISDWSSDVCSSDLSLTRVERWQLPPLQRDLEFGDERQQRRRLASQDRHPIIRGAVIRAMIDRHHPKDRSEEHTSELQSLMRISYAVFCLKKKNTTTTY